MSDHLDETARVLSLSEEVEATLDTFHSSDALITKLIFRNVTRNILKNQASDYAGLYTETLKRILSHSLLADDPGVLDAFQQWLIAMSKKLQKCTAAQPAGTGEFLFYYQRVNLYNCRVSL